MRKLPRGWTFAPIGDVTEDCGQRKPPDEEEFKYIDIASIDRDSKTIVSPQSLLGRNAPSRARKFVRAGDVLVSMTRPNLNAVALVPGSLDDQIASTGFDVLRAPAIEPRWLFYSVRSGAFIERMSKTVQGALYPAIKSKDVKGFEMPFAPLNEQTRIADKLDAVLARVDACRERLDRVPDILKRFRRSVLAAATSGELTKDLRADQVARMKPQAAPEDAVHEAAERPYAVHRNPDSPALHPGYEYAAVWPNSSVNEVAPVIFDGPFGSNLKSNDYTESGIRVVRLENIGWLKFHEEKRTYVSLEKYQTLQRHTLLGEDILFSSFISEQVRVCLIPNQFSGSAINKADCLCIRVNQTICLPMFLAMRLACRSTFLALEGKIHGATRPRVNLTQLRQLQFTLPPINEQHEIVRRVETLFAYADRLEDRYEAARTQVDRLTPALLAKAFRGELVPQDPNDEPATALLERIRAARPAASAKPRRGRSKPHMPDKSTQGAT